MKLPPCHAFFQFYVAGGRLSCQLYQRSADIFLGVPFNIASYALLTHLVAQQTDLEVGRLRLDRRRLPLYLNHLEQVDTQLARDTLPAAPTAAQAPARRRCIDYRYEDFEIADYQCHPPHQGGGGGVAAHRGGPKKSPPGGSERARGIPMVGALPRSERVRRCGPFVPRPPAAGSR